MRTFNYIVAGSALVCALASCKSQNQDDQATVQAPLVSLVGAVIEDVADEEYYSSTVEPWAKNNIVPQSSNRIEELLVEVGDYVQAGQVIARMDDVQLRQARLQVANDSIEFKRLLSLRNQGGVSQSDFDSFEMSCKVHQSSYENVKKNTVLRSPISGVISSRNFDKGDMYSMSQPIYVVEQIVPVKLLVGLSEADYTRVKKGDVAAVTVDAFPGQVFRGVITNVYPTIDSATHTFTVEVKVVNADRRLRPGMYAKVKITFGHQNRVVIEDKCIVKQQGSGNRYVYVFNAADSTVTFRQVKLGQRLNDRYVILDGVQLGDWIVNGGQLRLKDGIKVKVN